MNKYYQMLGKILKEGKVQTNKKGCIRYLLNERMALMPADLLDIFESHGIARKKLKTELGLFMQGERDVERYREAGITWWDYCGQTLVNSYPTYFENCRHSSLKSMRKSATARTMSCSSVQQEWKPTRHHALALYSFR